MMMTRDEAAAAAAAAAAERDRIQENLLDLESSFGMRLLSGPALTGVSKRRWDVVAADVASMWELFSAYSGVVERAADLVKRFGRSAGPELAEVSTLLTAASVRLAGPPPPLARRALTDTGGRELTVAAAVKEMAAIFARATEVTNTAERVWNEVTDRLDRVAPELGQARAQITGLRDDALAAALADAEAELDRMRGVLNSGPLTLWQRGEIDTRRLDRLAGQAAAVAARIGELTALRDDAERQVRAAAAAVAAAGAAQEDAADARRRAAAKIAAAALPTMPGTPGDLAGMSQRLAEAEALKAAGRWSRLAAELEAIRQQAAAAAERYAAIGRASLALLDRREELRGLLGAYQVKADRLGIAEDPLVSACYARAQDLLWVAPCDLDASADAVAAYQRAISGESGG